MKKIVSNVLIVATQLIIGGLFLFMLFSDSNEDNKVVVVENDNLNKMADAVSELFIVEQVNKISIDETKEVDLIAEEERKAKEAEEAKLKAEEERKAKEAEEAAKKAQEEEAARKAQEEAARNAVTVDATGYISKPAMGFNVTTGNRTYSLSDEEFNIVAGVVACEAAGKDDALAVMSVILNRADSSNYPSTPVGVVSQSGQFSCYFRQGDPSKYASVVRDALNGVRNNSYYSFNCPNCNPYIANYIVDNGNWYY